MSLLILKSFTGSFKDFDSHNRYLWKEAICTALPSNENECVGHSVSSWLREVHVERQLSPELHVGKGPVPQPVSSSQRSKCGQARASPSQINTLST